LVNTVNGFDVAYTHRGSWKAHRRLKGTIVDEIPVAWDRDWKAGQPPSLIVWFEDPEEAAGRLAAGAEFTVAVAKKTGLSASSANINGLFKVLPIQLSPDPQGVCCNVVGKCEAPGAALR
jgi:hypothetical protein